MISSPNSLRPRAAQLAEQQKQKLEGKAEQFERDWEKIRRFLAKEHPLDGETRRQIELNTDLSRDRVKKIIDAKVDSGALLRQVRPKPAGNTVKDQTVYVLSPPFRCLAEEPRDVGPVKPAREVEEETVER